MLEDLYTYCESPIENLDVKNKASAYEYLIKRFFEISFEKSNDYSLDLFPFIEINNGSYSTPDIELSTFLDGHKIIIVTEIKYFVNSSSNKKEARKEARQQMDGYIAAYKEKYPNIIIMPLFITQNSYFDIYQAYPCMILLPGELEKVDLKEKIREKIEEYSKYLSEHSNTE